MSGSDGGSSGKAQKKESKTTTARSKTKKKKDNAASRHGSLGKDAAAAAAAAAAAEEEQAAAAAESEVSVLKERIAQECPARGYAPLVEETRAFRTLPLSEATLKGLERQGFTIMTPIQNACLGHALAGRDVLGAAKTGSGKTLAFLIPVLETLYREGYAANRSSRWNDGGSGPGAIILSPTRELAAQTFDVLRKVGSDHQLSAGLVVGGTHSSSSSKRRQGRETSEWAMEQARIVATNILVATPGRLLQHLEQTVHFADALSSFLQVLVLDEADRILDMGFRSQLESILEYLPKEDRQTMLFSATQTKRVADLALLALHQPEYIGISDKAWKRQTQQNDNDDNADSTSCAMPSSLVQRLVVVPLAHKLDVLFSFIRQHLQSRIICFFATCAQVRFVHELFCALRPGVSVLALHGKLRQERRLHVYRDFWRRNEKQPHGTLLLATDVAARGLDFPAVDWVIQVDAPEDLPMYIHRAGRTARYQSKGQSLLMVRPGVEEKGFTNLLADLTVKKVRLNPQQTVQTSRRAASLVAANVTLQQLAKRAFASYIRCLSLMPRRDEFFGNLTDDERDGFATSLGLAFTPSLSHTHNTTNRVDLRQAKNVNRQLQKLKEEIQKERMDRKKTKRKGNDAEEEEEEEEEDEQDVVEEEDDFLVVKRKHGPATNDEDETALPVVPPTRRRRNTAKRIRIDVGASTHQRLVFDEHGQVQSCDWKSLVPDQHADVVTPEAAARYQEEVQRRLQATAKEEAAQERRRVQELHKKKKKHKKRQNAPQEEHLGGAILDVSGDWEDPDEGVDMHHDGANDKEIVEESDIRQKEEEALAMLL